MAVKHLKNSKTEEINTDLKEDIDKNTQYKVCVEQAVNDYDNGISVIENTYKDCVERKICLPFDPKILSAMEEGKAKLVKSLESDRKVCDLKYK